MEIRPLAMFNVTDFNGFGRMPKQTLIVRERFLSVNRRRDFLWRQVKLFLETSESGAMALSVCATTGFKTIIVNSLR